MFHLARLGTVTRGNRRHFLRCGPRNIKAIDGDNHAIPHNPPMLTMPTRPLVALGGAKPKRYVPAASTDVSRTFDKYRRLIALQNARK